MKPHPTRIIHPLPDRLRERLNAAHHGLLIVHKALLDHERIRYERQHGTIGSSGELLQLVIGDPWFAWLRLASGLIVQIDEYLEAKEPADPRDGEALLTQARTLSTPSETGSEFQRNYQRALQESPEVTVAQGEWKRALVQMDQKS